ncbi:MAG: hypothetical protein ACJ74Y_09055 [Bryobacteraceae bacterium]
MRLATFAFLPVLLWAQDAPQANQGALAALPHNPHLLLSSQRLKRLKRDRERQTLRWANFADRVESAPDSAERGFELALFYAVTGDEAKGREAVQWAKDHPCERRQVALIRDWCAALFTAEPARPSCPRGRDGTLSALRDELFYNAAAGEDTESEVERDRRPLVDKLRAGSLDDQKELYAAIEYLSAARSVERVDLREEDPRFFSSLPVELLLALKPKQVEHPDWWTHIAALALVSLDPNLDSSQFLQAWAIEDRQTIHEGEGVAYEFLWGDPYLPGVGYQNLDPWLYDPSRGVLIGRTDWTPSACWIRVTPAGAEAESCPSDWESKPLTLGHLTLVPKLGPCVKLPNRIGNESMIIWKAPPRSKLTYMDGKVQETTTVDGAGMWRVPSNATAQACTAAP